MNLTAYWQCARCQTKHEIMTVEHDARVGEMITISPYYIKEVFHEHFCKACSYPMSAALLIVALVAPEPTIVDEERTMLLE